MTAHTVITHALEQGALPMQRVVYPQGAPVPGLPRPALTEGQVRGALGAHVQGRLAANDLDALARTFAALARRGSLLRLRASRARVVCGWSGGCMGGEDAALAVTVVAGVPLCGFHSPYDVPQGVSLVKPSDR